MRSIDRRLLEGQAAIELEATRGVGLGRAQPRQHAVGVADDAGGHGLRDGFIAVTVGRIEGPQAAQNNIRVQHDLRPGSERADGGGLGHVALQEDVARLGQACLHVREGERGYMHGHRDEAERSGQHRAARQTPDQRFRQARADDGDRASALAELGRVRGLRAEQGREPANVRRGRDRFRGRTPALQPIQHAAMS